MLFYFWANYTFNPLNPSLLSLSYAKKHLHATSAIGSCPLPFISIHRASQSHRHRATFFSFRMCVRPCVERDLLCTFPLKKREDGDEWMRGKIWGLADSLVRSISRRQTSLPLRAWDSAISQEQRIFCHFGSWDHFTDQKPRWSVW